MKTKRITLLAVIILTINFGCLDAQTNQGKVLLGLSSPLNMGESGSDLMNFNYSRLKAKSDADNFSEPAPNEMTIINISPMVGYFVLDNFATGLKMNYAFSSQNNGENNSKVTQSLLSVGPFIRYYIPMPKVLPFFELSSSFGELNNKYDFGDNFDLDISELMTSLMSFGGGIGLAVPLGERVTFDVLAAYNSSTLIKKEDNEDNERVIISTLALKFGFTILLGTNKKNALR